ncbi:MAG: NifB/NifX family molybdenum-iron cluster-binding protein [Desulfovibrio sp.]
MIVCLACYQDRLASVFENASEFRLYRVDDEKNIYPAGHVSLPSKDPTDRTSAILACGVNLLVCGGVCGGVRKTLESGGLDLRPWLRGGVDEVLAALRDNELERLSMPGCRRHRGGQGSCRDQEQSEGSHPGFAPGMEPGLGRRCRRLAGEMGRKDNDEGVSRMKVAISCEGSGLDSRLDPRFGRAAGFLICDLEDGSTEYVDNEQNLSLPQGAGIQSAQTVANTGAKAVVTGHMGPKAFLALEKGGIKVYLGAEGTAGENLEAYKAGKLSQADGPDKEGHW